MGRCCRIALDLSSEYANISTQSTSRRTSARQQLAPIVLSSGLSLQTVLPGLLEGFLGADYGILARNEIHFMSVQPLHIEVFDLKRKQLVEVYPYKDDTQRRQFSRLIEPHIVPDWCREHNAACDPRTSTPV